MQRHSQIATTQRPRSWFRRNFRWIIIFAVLLIAVLLIYVLRSYRHSSQMSAELLECTASQDVTPFRDGFLFYDNTSLQYCGEKGNSRWSFPLGSNARFSVSSTHIVAWSGQNLFILNQNGSPSYSENQADQVQFARIGTRYCASVIGDDTNPTLVIRNLDGTPVDEETEAYRDKMLLDMGFYGEADQYLWTLSMDVYGTAINTVLNTYQVGKMNTGIVDLGEFLAYKVLYEDGKLHVFTTQQMYTYDYKAVQDMSGTQLVYGWQLVGATVPERGSASMLLVPNSQMTTTQSITQLRVLTGTADRRYTLPSACVGAAIQGRNLYAVSPEYVYRADVDQQRFYAYSMPLPDHAVVDSLIGVTSGGYALVTCGDQVYSVSLPK
ncbi:MAG: hypothetical protein IJ083_01875 [Clostridia bacterium]|nr:hypothetical protein [Clostridia bacterium]